MKSSQIKLLILALIFLAAYNVIVFVAPFKFNGVFWISYVFSMVAMLLQIPAMKFAFDKGNSLKSKFYGFPIARISVIYVVVQLLVSLVFMAVSVFIPNWIPALLYSLILCVSAIGFISADITRDEIEMQDTKLKETVKAMRSLQSKSNLLVTQCGDNSAYPYVKDLAEEFKYSDPVTNSATQNIENELSVYLDTLQAAVVDNDTDVIISLCKRTASLLAERNRLCKLNK